MRFMMLYTPDKSKDRSQHIPRTMAKMAEMKESKKLLTAAGIAGRDGAARVVLSDGEPSRERPPQGQSVLFDADGFVLVEATNLDDATDIAADFIGAAGDGAIDLVQLVDAPPAK